MVAGVPAHVDGRMLGITEAAGGRIINPDRMWHYVEGLRNWDPIWDNHGIRILPGPSSLWLDATGRRLPAPYFPGFDTLGTLRHLRTTGHDYSWFVLTQKIIEKEFALSGSEQNPDLTGKDVKLLLSRVIQFSVDLEDRQRALVEGAEDRVVDQHVAAGHLGVELHDRGAAGGDQRGLHVLLEAACRPRSSTLSKISPITWKLDTRFGPPLPTNRRTLLAGLRRERLVAGERAFGAVEQHVGRLLVDRLLHVERLQALLAVLARRVEVALHHVVLVIDLAAGLRGGSTRIRPYMPLATCMPTGAVAQW